MALPLVKGARLGQQLDACDKYLAIKEEELLMPALAAHGGTTSELLNLLRQLYSTDCWKYRLSHLLEEQKHAEVDAHVVKSYFQTLHDYIRQNHDNVLLIEPSFACEDTLARFKHESTSLSTLNLGNEMRKHFVSVGLLSLTGELAHSYPFIDS